MTNCKITRVGRDEHKYEQAGRQVVVYTELCTKEIDFMIDLPAKMTWSDGAAVTDEDRKEIRANLESWMQDHGKKFSYRSTIE